MIKIEKGIPLPEKQSIYPFEQMEVGDSIMIENKTLRAVGAIVAGAVRRLPMSFKSHAIGSGVRVWRVG